MTSLFKSCFRSGAAIALLFSALKPAQRASAAVPPTYIFSTFTGDHANEMTLQIYTSTDATNFTLYADTGYSGPPGCSLRDPSIMKHTDGRYYIVFTAPPYNKPYARQNFVGLAWSTNLQTWNTLPSMYTTNIPGVKLSWAPEWVVDGSGVPRFIVHCSSASSDLRPYLYTATNSDLTGWSGPVDIGIGSMHLDGQLLKVGDTWHCFIKSNLMQHAVAPSITGPWTWLPDRADWVNLEGPCAVQCSNGSWIMYVDPMYDVAQYMTSPDLTNWSPLAYLPGPGKIIKHGTVIRDDAFNLPPPTARPAPKNSAVTGPKPWGNWPRWGDQGDGTYRNPVLPSDYSDIDCIRVGSDYYAVSSTFQYSPGMVILHSKDLVNWHILGHVIDDVTQIGPELNWDRMDRYGRGVWAGAMRYHDGRFWVYFGTPDEGYFMSTAKDPAGPWEPLHCVMHQPGWDDCCPFWDDDGQGYLVGTCFKDGYKTWLFKLTADGRDLIPGWRVLLNEGAGREANKLYKINGTYYHLYSEHQPGVGRYLMMQRATNIAGPYVEKHQLAHAQPEAHEPNQGGLVQTVQGEWYFLTHHGTGDWEGRCASLLPVTWVDRWPILGAVANDGIGRMVWSGLKPVTNAPAATPQTDDDFNGTKLGAQWEWNYQPRADQWSLSERPGFLRLHAFKPVQRDNLKKAGNTLTQRTFRSATNIVTLALDLTGMADGQVVGLCHYSKDFSTIAVRRLKRILTLESAHNQSAIHGPVLTTSRLWLRSSWGLDGNSSYSYSTNGFSFTPFGETYPLAWGDYRGDRIGIFTYNNDAEAGYVDCDSCVYRHAAPIPDSRNGQIDASRK